MRLYTVIVGSACAVSMVLANVTFATAFVDSNYSVAAKAIDALNEVDSKLVATAAASATDADSAARTAMADIPADPAQGVILHTSDGSFITIDLPNAQNLGRGIKQANGMVLYPGINEADQVVVPTATGAQFLTLINGVEAPEDYGYPVTIPAGGRIELSSDGSAIILDTSSKPVAVIALPWAVDAKELKVATKFTTNGTTLVQHITHKTAQVTYPVIADPSVSFGAINFTLWYGKQEVKSMRAAGYWNALGLVATYACGRIRNPWFGAACTVAFGSAWWWINQTFSDAANNNQCVWISVSYGADLDGWGRYGC